MARSSSSAAQHENMSVRSGRSRGSATCSLQARTSEARRTTRSLNPRVAQPAERAEGLWEPALLHQPARALGAEVDGCETVKDDGQRLGRKKRSTSGRRATHRWSSGWQAGRRNRAGSARHICRRRPSPCWRRSRGRYQKPSIAATCDDWYRRSWVSERRIDRVKRARRRTT